MKKRKLKLQGRSYSDKIFDIVNVFVIAVLFVVFAWPLWFVLIASLSDPAAVQNGQVLLLPKGFTLEGYIYTFQSAKLWKGYLNTIGYTLAGTLLNLVLTVCCAYPLSDKNFGPRKVFIWIFMFTMYFGGGTVPTYLVVKNLGLVNTRWAMILPGAISVYNMLVVRSYFMNSIPEALKEAATLDGANTATYLWKIVLPLSKPVLAVVGLYYMVAHWNDFYNALLYIYDQDLYPLQSVLRELLMNSQTQAFSDTLDTAEMIKALDNSMLMKYCIIIVSCVPMLCAYPFVQKYFVKGMMVGSVKG